MGKEEMDNKRYKYNIMSTQKKDFHILLEKSCPIWYKKWQESTS